MQAIRKPEYIILLLLAIPGTVHYILRESIQLRGTIRMVKHNRISVIKTQMRDELLKAYEEVVKIERAKRVEAVQENGLLSPSGRVIRKTSWTNVTTRLMTASEQTDEAKLRDISCTPENLMAALSRVRAIQQSGERIDLNKYKDVMERSGLTANMRLSFHQFLDLAAHIMYTQKLDNLFYKNMNYSSTWKKLLRYEPCECVMEHFFGDFWNVFDLMTVFYLPTVIGFTLYWNISGHFEEVCSPVEYFGSNCTDSPPCGDGCQTQLAPEESVTRAMGLHTFNIMLLFVKTLCFLRPYRPVGSLVKTIFRIIYDSSSFLIIMLMFVIATNVAMIVLLPNLFDLHFFESSEALASFLAKLTSLAVGDWTNSLGTTSDPRNSYIQREIGIRDSVSPGMVDFVYVVFVFMVPIIMGNLLIAIMQDSYAAIQENAHAEFLLEKAKALAEIETFMTQQELARKDWFPDYLHLLIPTAFLDGVVEEKEEWTGVVHRITSEISKLSRDQRRGDAQRGQTVKKLDELAEQFQERQAEHTLQAHKLSQKVAHLETNVQAIAMTLSSIDSRLAHLVVKA